MTRTVFEPFSALYGAHPVWYVASLRPPYKTWFRLDCGLTYVQAYDLARIMSYFTPGYEFRIILNIGLRPIVESFCHRRIS